ncbi:MAG TPA: acyl-CoA thioesterase/BAAT N-terminal domain-containing protein, partial [Ktedonobacterales bacterium]|nr:acyl-CoA thioesterase/BAAT N-terminal domain-containing protein [Ktedonobacterales bacterium]
MPTLEVNIAPNPALVDEPLRIRLAGLAPGQRVTLAARTADGAGHGWSSQATFAADEAGAIDLASAAPLDGSYA